MTAAAEIARPRLRVFAGPNGSGKSTIQELLKPEWIGVYINADDIEKQLGRTGTLDLGAHGLVSAPEVLQQRQRAQIAEYERIRARVERSIPVYDVAGNHDVENVPTPASLAA